MSQYHEQGSLGLAICVGFGCLILFNILLGWIPILGWIIAGLAAGFFAGLIAKGGAKYGAKAGFGSGMIGALILFVLVLILGSMIPVGGVLFAGTGGALIIALGLINSIFPTIGGAIGGHIRRGKSQKSENNNQFQQPNTQQSKKPILNDIKKVKYSNKPTVGSSYESKDDNQIPCPECDQMSDASNHECSNCGNPIEGTCDGCGAKYRNGSEYCHNCGDELVKEGKEEDVSGKIGELKSEKESLEEELQNQQKVLEKAEERLANGEIDQESFKYIRDNREKKIDEVEKEIKELKMELEDLTTEQLIYENEEEDID